MKDENKLWQSKYRGHDIVIYRPGNAEPHLLDPTENLPYTYSTYEFTEFSAAALLRVFTVGSLFQIFLLKFGKKIHKNSLQQTFYNFPILILIKILSQI